MSHPSAPHPDHPDASRPVAAATTPFVFDFVPTKEPGEGRRWSTWSDVTAGSHGPTPRPDWVITADAAIDTELGAIKSGKEADCFLLERGIPDGPTSTLVAKRYRDADHREFHRTARYTEGRRGRNSRDARAVARKTRHGRAVSAGQWAQAEWGALVRLWQLGVPVPYPVQIDGTELLLELITDAGEIAPRLVNCRPDPRLLGDLWRQLTDALLIMTSAGLVHGDLSPYNILVGDGRLVIIDLPQLVDLVSNPFGFELLQRDCRNVADWFVRRGLDVDGDALFDELMTVV